MLMCAVKAGVFQSSFPTMIGINRIFFILFNCGFDVWVIDLPKDGPNCDLDLVI